MNKTLSISELREKEKKLTEEWLKKNKPTKCHDAYEGRTYGDLESLMGYNKTFISPKKQID